MSFFSPSFHEVDHGSRRTGSLRRHDSTRRSRRMFLGVEACEDRLALSSVVHIAQTEAGSVSVPMVSMDQSTGESVLAWDGPNGDVYFKTVPAGGTVTLDTGTDITNNGTNGITSTAIGLSMNENGEFVVAYENHNYNNPTVDGEWFQRFNASGSPVGAAVSVGILHGDQKYGNVAMDNSGDVVIFQAGVQPIRPPGGASARLDAEEFTSSNTTAGQFNITTDAIWGGGGATIAMDQVTGSFVVGYVTPGTNASSIIADKFAPFATSGTAFTVATDYVAAYPSVAINDSGELAVSWMGENSSLVETVQVALFNSSGSPISGGGVAFTAPSGFSIAATSISLNNSGSFATAWTYTANYTTFDFGVSLNLGAATVVSNDADSQGDNFFVAIDKNGNYVVSWQGSNSTGSGVFGSYYP